MADVPAARSSPAPPEQRKKIPEDPISDLRPHRVPAPQSRGHRDPDVQNEHRNDRHRKTFEAEQYLQHEPTLCLEAEKAVLSSAPEPSPRTICLDAVAERYPEEAHRLDSRIVDTWR